MLLSISRDLQFSAIIIGFILIFPKLNVNTNGYNDHRCMWENNVDCFPRRLQFLTISVNCIVYTKLGVTNIRKNTTNRVAGKLKYTKPFTTHVKYSHTIGSCCSCTSGASGLICTRRSCRNKQNTEKLYTKYKIILIILSL